MVDADILRRRLDALLGYLTRLERFKTVARAEFSTEPDPITWPSVTFIWPSSRPWTSPIT